MQQDTSKKTEKELFLDNYFITRLQEIIRVMDRPDTGNRDEHTEAVLDLLYTLSDEYQAVIIENEEAYWDSIETWNAELQQRLALNWISELTERRVD